MSYQKSSSSYASGQRRCFVLVLTLLFLFAFTACSSTDDNVLQDGGDGRDSPVAGPQVNPTSPISEETDREGDPDRDGGGESVNENVNGGEVSAPISTDGSPTQPLNIEDLQAGVLTSEEVEAVLLLINQPYQNMLFYRTNLYLFWDVSLGSIGDKTFLQQAKEQKVAEGLVVESFGDFTYSKTLLDELSIVQKEVASLATINIADYRYFIDHESNVYVRIPDLVGQKFKFDSGDLAITVLDPGLLREGWIRANLESDLFANEQSLSFVKTVGYNLPRLMDPEFVSTSLRQAKYVGEVPITDDLTQEEVQYDLFSFEFGYSDLATRDDSVLLFNIFNDDLGVSDDEIMSLAGDAPVTLKVYMNSADGTVERIETTLNLSLVLLEYFGDRQTSDDTSPSGVKFIIGTRQDFSQINDPALTDEFIEISSSGDLPNILTLDRVVELADILP